MSRRTIKWACKLEFETGGGVPTYLAERECAALRVAFLQEILKHGSRFLPKKSLNMGQLFWLSPKLPDFWGFCHAKTLKIAEFLKNRPIFEGKSLKMGTFLAKITLKDGYGFWGSSGTPLSNSNLNTPRGLRACTPRIGSLILNFPWSYKPNFLWRYSYLH